MSRHNTDITHTKITQPWGLSLDAQLPHYSLIGFRPTLHMTSYNHKIRLYINTHAHIIHATGSLTSYILTTSKSYILTLLSYTLTTSKSVFTLLFTYNGNYGTYVPILLNQSEHPFSFPLIVCTR